MAIRRVAAFLALAILAPAPWSFAAVMQDPAIAKLSALSGTAFDVAYMRAAIPVGDEAVEMAMTATLYADHADLLHRNQSFTERERGQIRQMLGLLQDMGSHPTERNEGVATAPIKKLRTLRGAALERTYITLMTQHLDRSAALAKLAARKADRPALRSLAATIAAVDGREAAMLRGWSRSWYR